MFTDDSVRCEGPIRPGPVAQRVGRRGAGPAAGHARADGRGGRPHPHHVPVRASSRAPTWRGSSTGSPPTGPAGVTLHLHRTRATAIDDEPDGSQIVTLDGEPALVADVVVLALGHLDVDPTGPEAELAAFAADHGLFYLPPEYSADVDLSAVPAGADVVVRGMGLAFIDLMILLTEGRGGTFTTDAGGRLAYHPSGAEPRLHVGSRRGVPYHAKTSYRLQGGPLELPKFLTADAVDALPGRASAGRLPAPRVAAAGQGDLLGLLPGAVHRPSRAHHHAVGRPSPSATRAVELGHRRLRRAGGRGRARRRRPPRPRPPRPAAAGPPLRHRRRAAGPPARPTSRPTWPGAATRPTAPTSARSWRCCPASASCPASWHRASSVPARGSSEMDGWWFGFFSYLASGPPPDRLEQLAGPGPRRRRALPRRRARGRGRRARRAASSPAATTVRPSWRPSGSSRPACRRPTCAAPATSWCAAS